MQRQRYYCLNSWYYLVLKLDVAPIEAAHRNTTIMSEFFIIIAFLFSALATNALPCSTHDNNTIGMPLDHTIDGIFDNFKSFFNYSVLYLPSAYQVEMNICMMNILLGEQYACDTAEYVKYVVNVANEDIYDSLANEDSCQQSFIGIRYLYILI